MRDKHPVVVARVAEPGTATEPERFGALGVEPRDRKESDQQAVGPLGRVGSNPTPGAYVPTCPLAFLRHICTREFAKNPEIILRGFRH